MPFRRRTERSFSERVRDSFWPRLGWRRYAKYLRLRLTRLHGTPHTIALGAACGVLLAPTPLLGAHLIGAALLAVLLRGNVIASALGSLVGNPWTYTFLWPLTFELGRFLVPAALWSGNQPDNFGRFFAEITDAALALNVSVLIEKGAPALVLMMIGSVPLGVAGAIGAYWAVRRSVERFQLAREHRRQRRRAQRAAPRNRVASARFPTG